jgi:acetolactate synthase small subunit
MINNLKQLEIATQDKDKDEINVIVKKIMNKQYTNKCDIVAYENGEGYFPLEKIIEINNLFEVNCIDVFKKSIRVKISNGREKIIYKDISFSEFLLLFKEKKGGGTL